ncbi:hypothetical protein SAMN05216464_106208 [Mucilaginibacter pineti]|uniref:Uncharacterized protein n=1 Tax=Mucilaginibacter pineti TaxID=1391627 RepID=A0A1G7D2D9_9SPHI|nr:hypothetical protein [Mucilaginibacter pineti]SDE45677.1 hypothetical protein SAMN05216464_106208 [Mucilaginibacter pineti]
MSNFTFAKDYLLHRLKANNRHGVHSPFVYNLIDNVIYDYADKEVYREMGEDWERRAGSAGIKLKVVRLLYRLTKHFDPATIIHPGNADPIIKCCLHKAAPNAGLYTQENPPAKADLIYIEADDSKDNALKHSNQSLPSVHEDTVLILAGIYKSAGMKQAWAQAKNHPQVTLTIDLFWIGLVFFKSGRAEKEHFRVKY